VIATGHLGPEPTYSTRLQRQRPLCAAQNRWAVRLAAGRASDGHALMAKSAKPDAAMTAKSLTAREKVVLFCAAADIDHAAVGSPTSPRTISLLQISTSIDGRRFSMPSRHDGERPHRTRCRPGFPWTRLSNSGVGRGADGGWIRRHAPALRRPRYNVRNRAPQPRCRGTAARQQPAGRQQAPSPFFQPAPEACSQGQAPSELSPRIGQQRAGRLPPRSTLSKANFRRIRA